jgi:hypothetical protein
MPNGIDEIFTIRLLAHPVNAETMSSFVCHHIGATTSWAEASSTARSSPCDGR